MRVASLDTARCGPLLLQRMQHLRPIPPALPTGPRKPPPNIDSREPDWTRVDGFQTPDLLCPNPPLGPLEERPLPKRKRAGRKSGRERHRSGREAAAPARAHELPQDRSPQALAAWMPGRLPGLVLQVIAEGDPLGIEDRVKGLLRKSAWLLDVERMVARGMAAIAFAAYRYNGFPDLDSWIVRELERGARTLIEEDAEAVLEAQPADFETASSLRWLTESLGLPAAAATRATVVFHALPEDVRRAWYAQAVDKLSLDECVAAGMGTRERIEALSRRATQAMSLAADPGDPLP